MKDSRDWPSPIVKSWQHFTEMVARTRNMGARLASYVFRGHPDASFLLTPKLLRLLPAGTSTEVALELEDFACKQFQSQAHLHYDAASLPKDEAQGGLGEWWALMRHHGAPTRLLDWTASPYIAAYFATESHPLQDGSVLQVHPHTIMAGAPNNYPIAFLRTPTAPSTLFFMTPPKKSRRLAVQQGTFSLSPNILADHDAVLTSAEIETRANNPNVTVASRWIIPANLKPEFMRQLRVMNIDGGSLFPGLDGLGRYLGEVVG